ncbi:hypothetical protein BDP55DRAFT_163783 [Colletotrichum godetiae]|uniref:Uncharacterized protein n=1 Tax=Colletotrichum godetiae TaxID=1209918 RepID=A0AAJ0ETC6_9PEZI|nr:uncharacterized protein BDP55DRAFT_163783 [Colletotrichum godetiae]KAK1674887.1 hypothetical protein BDP55DRAFT_163783 [Colletotrichum godetiae]
MGFTKRATFGRVVMSVVTTSQSTATYDCAEVVLKTTSCPFELLSLSSLCSHQVIKSLLLACRTTTREPLHNQIQDSTSKLTTAQHACHCSCCCCSGLRHAHFRRCLRGIWCLLPEWIDQRLYFRKLYRQGRRVLHSIPCRACSLPCVGRLRRRGTMKTVLSKPEGFRGSNAASSQC